jgi:hypothetical protein
MSASAVVPAGPVRPDPGDGHAPARRVGPGPVARRAGHVVGALVNVALVVALVGWPGWQVVPFLTDGFRGVVWLLAVSLLLNAAAELIYAVVDRPRVKAAGDVLTLAVSLLVTVRLWQAFPFDLPEAVVRALLVLAIVGTVIGMIVAVVTALGLRSTAAAARPR